MVELLIIKLSVTPALIETMQDEERLISNTKLVKGLLETIEGFSCSGDFIVADTENSATLRAGERTVVFKPGNVLLEFIAALRAGDINNKLIR